MKSQGDIVDTILKDTSPGNSNDHILNTIHSLEDVVEGFISDTNGWFEILDVRVYPDGSIGIPCRWRWTIERYAAAKIEDRLLDSGWAVDHHLEADSRKHNEDRDLQLRYRKNIQGHDVYINVYVWMTDNAFNALETNEPIQIGDRDITNESDIDGERRRHRQTHRSNQRTRQNTTDRNGRRSRRS